MDNVISGALTLRDYYAARAPEIPEWFTTWFRERYPAEPAAPTVDTWALTAPARQFALQWAQDPRYNGASAELAEQFRSRHRPVPGKEHAASDLTGLRSYQQAYEAWRKAHTTWQNDLWLDQLVSWRFTYADAMCSRPDRKVHELPY